jgi:hypothetical protein
MGAEGSREQQVPPLRYAPVGMTKGRVEFPARFDADGENCRSLGCARDDKWGGGDFY